MINITNKIFYRASRVKDLRVSIIAHANLYMLKMVLNACATATLKEIYANLQVPMNYFKLGLFLLNFIDTYT